MSSVKELRLRLKGVETIQKITKAMKMVAASRLRAMQRVARQVLSGMKFFPSFFQGVIGEQEKARLLVPVTSERGLCGGINSSVNKSTLYIANSLIAVHIQAIILIIGSKGKDFLLRNCGNLVFGVIDQMGTKTVPYTTAALLAEELSVLKADQITLLFNVFESVATQRVYVLDLLNQSIARKRVSISYVNELDDSSEADLYIMQDLYIYSLSYLLLYALMQNRTSEQAARVNAMEAASKNAGEIINTLRLIYNKARQASITKELIEIISCANAISSK